MSILKEIECKQCKKMFSTYKSKKQKFCSKGCYWEWMNGPKGDKAPNWKGERASINAIHKWLKTNFGKPRKCDNPNCKRVSKYFDWCLIKNKEYRHKRENFMRFCRRCHLIYDGVVEHGRKLGLSNKGKKYVTNKKTT